MKLTLLGTSHGVPTDIRCCSSYMLEVGDNIYLFDGGAPVMEILLSMGKDVNNVKAFFNTHFHGDHVLGILGMTSLFSWYYKETDTDFYLPDEKSKEAFINIISAVNSVPFPSERLRVNVYGEGVIFDDGAVKVTVIPTNHSCGVNRKANAFLIEAEDRSILFTGDMSATLEDFPAVAYERYIDVIMSECAHCPVEVLAKCMEKVDTDNFIVTHIHPLSKIDELKAIEDNFDFQMIIAEDNDEIEF